MKRWGSAFVGCSLLLSCLVLPGHSAKAEMYVAGQFGVTIPNSFSNLEGQGSLAGQNISDLSLHKSVMYGAKLGYYLESVKWLGVETEVFNTTPHVKQQDASVNGVPAGTLQGINLRVLTWAPVNVVLRYKMGDLEPYAGVGLGVFFARASTSGESSSSTQPGLNTQVGLRYLVTKNLSVFGEWKYNRASFNFSDSTPTAAVGGVKGDYSAHILAFGVGYHF
jgi:opacity protein-like surface antigen